MEFRGDHGADHGADLLVREGLGFDPFTDSPTVILNHVCDLEPGLLVQSALAMLDPAALSPGDAVRYLQVHDRVASWWASLQSAALVAAAGRTPSHEEFVLLDRLCYTEREVRIAERARDEVAAALRWGSVTAQARIDQARLLVGPLESTQVALSLGEITSVHVRVIADAAQRLSTWHSLEQAIHNASRKDTPENQESIAKAQSTFDSDCAALQSRVLPIARRQGVARTKSKANTSIDIIDEQGQARRKAAARRHRDVYVSSDTDGISTLIARLDTLTANAIMSAVNASVANPDIPGACDATVGERRGESLAALIFGTQVSPTGTGVTHDHGTGSGCLTPISVNISVDLTVPITELDTKIGPDSLDCDLRHLLADPGVNVFARPVSINDHGHILDVGRRRYQITGSLRRLIIARDGTCRFPGCNRSAVRCQIDHAIGWENGGRSDVGNLGALCVGHHQLKTHGGWELTNSKRDGSCTWRSPEGFIYHHYPEPIVTPKRATAVVTARQARAPNPQNPSDLPPF